MRELNQTSNILVECQGAIETLTERVRKNEQQIALLQEQLEKDRNKLQARRNQKEILINLFTDQGRTCPTACEYKEGQEQ